MKQTETNLSLKIPKFSCDDCQYKTNNKKDYTKHITTPKHINMKQNETNETHIGICPIITNNICQCGLNFNSRTTLWRHKKKCINNQQSEKNTDNKEELIDYLIKENKEFKNLILEIVKKDATTNNISTISNSNINSNNKTFNMQFFLNETCKNAMNISEFVDSIKLQISDLESVGKIGYIEGLTKIIIKNLKALDVTERPVHCSDTKRDTMYVKDDDKWEKDAEDNHKVLKAIEDIANKNTKQIKEWKRLNPECASSKSHKADVYSHILIEALCSNNDVNNYKVLKKIAKEVAIDKSYSNS